jgi:hypothetical protein
MPQAECREPIVGLGHPAQTKFIQATVLLRCENALA